MERSCDEWDDLICLSKCGSGNSSERLVAGRTEQWRRIRQFAGDMGISYDEAKGLIKEGRRRRDGGKELLGLNMGKIHGTRRLTGRRYQFKLDVIERDTRGRSAQEPRREATKVSWHGLMHQGRQVQGAGKYATNPLAQMAEL